jgi:hypothetical protein
MSSSGLKWADDDDIGTVKEAQKYLEKKIIRHTEQITSLYIRITQGFAML